MATTQIDNLDVVVVGAGLSGLRAAREIHAAGLKYVVLEAMDRVGGKTLSVPASSKGTGVVDLGAAWINDTNQSEMYSLAQEFSFDLVKQRGEGDSVVRAPDGKIDKVPYGMLAKVRLRYTMIPRKARYSYSRNINNARVIVGARTTRAAHASSTKDRRARREKQYQRS